MRSKIQLAGFGILVAVGIAVTIWLARPKVWLVTTSPKGTYTVRMTGDPKAPKSLFTQHQTRFDLMKDGEWKASNVFVYSYDFLDSDFQSEHEWVSDSVLRFGNPGTIADDSDSITVVNNTDDPISYLKLDANDRFLLFDLAPHDNATLAIPHPPTGRYIAADGKFAQGSAIREYGVDFTYDQQMKPPLHFCVFVGSDGVKIVSTSLVGSVGYPNPIQIPKVADCGSIPSGLPSAK
jgi:hypothetical protein